MKFSESELEDWIQVSVENDRDLRLFADLPYAFEHAAGGRSGGESALRGELIDDSIGERIGKRQTKLENVRAGFFEREPKIDRAVKTGIARANVGDKPFALLGAELGKALVDLVGHLRSKRSTPKVFGASCSNVQRPTLND